MRCSDRGAHKKFQASLMTDSMVSYNLCLQCDKLDNKFVSIVNNEEAKCIHKTAGNTSRNTCIAPKYSLPFLLSKQERFYPSSQ
jgi:hypothetical protein